MEKRSEIANELSCLATSQKKGRPEYSQNDRLLQTVQEIAILGSESDDRRRCELKWSVRMLDDR